jgi:hypothetical protein
MTAGKLTATVEGRIRLPVEEEAEPLKRKSRHAVRFKRLNKTHLTRGT